MLFEAVLNGFAILSTIVATLRAGSRVLYIAEHGTIGLIDGPKITPPPSASFRLNSTETTATISGDGMDGQKPKDPYNPALYELAENFKQCVLISSSKAADNSLHGCENLIRDVQIPDLPPVSSVVVDKSPPPTDDDQTIKNYIFGSFRQVSDRIRSFASERSKNPKKKDPFGNKAYSLGYTRYLPKTFRKILNKKSSLEPSRAAVTEAVRATAALYNFEDPFDFGHATEADYYYHAVFPSRDGATKRRRVAQLKAYCPETFGDLRSSIFGISEEEYLQSVLGTMVSFQSNSKGAARAGGIFFFTSDGAYMIKTIPNREKKTLLKILPDYYDHMKRNGRSSLLTRFCGMYGMTIAEEDETQDGVGDPARDVLASPSEDASSSFAPTGKEYTFVVMNAVFPAEASSFMSERFDLKGSTVGREVSREELESKGRMAVLKDLDLSREVDLVRAKQREQEQQQEEEERIFWNTHPYRNRWRKLRRRIFRSHFGTPKRRGKKADPAGFTIGATAKAALLSQLRKDVHFLTQCQVMDYSLLVGVVHTDRVIGGCDTGLGGGNAAGITPEIVESIQEQNKILERLEPNSEANRRRRPKLDLALLHTLTTPVRLMLSPPLYVARKTWNTLRLTLDTIVTAPMPYYGSGLCGVYGGKLAIINGKRKGERAVYYMGLIDFLQPWTTRKVMERKLKGMAGYDTNAISAVTPEEYATRFLEFLDKNIN